MKEERWYIRSGGGNEEAVKIMTKEGISAVRVSRREDNEKESTVYIQRAEAN